MIEFFQLIASKPIEFLAGLGVSSATIYSIITIIKFFISLATRKKTAAKENLKFEQIANIIIDKFGGLENFIDKVAVRVISKIAPSLEEFKQILQELKSKENCPVELKAYIDTVLKFNGDKELILAYEELKRQLTNQVIENTREIIAQGEQKLEQEKIEQENKVVEPQPIAQAEEQTQSKKKTKHNKQTDSDISYA